jgi:pyruvyltransferase
MIKMSAWAAMPNFGDQLSKVIVEWITGSPAVLVHQDVCGKLVALGSILHFTRPGDIVWGTGIHPLFYHEFWKTDADQLDLDISVWAVRGPLTRDLLLSKNIACPSVFGDPAILMPQVYPKSHNPTRKIGFVPHFADQNFFIENKIEYIDVLSDWKTVIDGILDCEKIIASSLHGLIVAEAYGIPAVWFRISDRQGMIKYMDYYAGTNRIPIPAYTLQEALKASCTPLPQSNSHMLIKAFKHESLKIISADL